jgi:DNA repair photolyase
MKLMNWEPWTGCYAVSDGCTYCYFYGPYSKRHGQNIIEKTAEFDKPLAKTVKGEFKIKSGGGDYLLVQEHRLVFQTGR